MTAPDLRRSLVVIPVTTSVIALVALIGVPAVAVADEPVRLLVHIAGSAQGFTAEPRQPLLDMRRLAPGLHTSGAMGARNESDDRATLQLEVSDVSDDDNGCNPPEARVDSDCGAGDGELADQLVMSVESADQEDGPYRPTWHGSLYQLADGVAVDDPLPPRATRWLRLTAALPRFSGNETQTDVVGFQVRLEMSYAGGDETVAVKGTKVGRETDAPAGTAAAVVRRLASLPATGGVPWLVAVVGFGLVVSGAVLRRRRGLGSS